MTRLVGVNAAGVHATRQRTRRILRETFEVPGISAAAFVEVADVRVDTSAPGDWRVLQWAQSSPDKAGVALAVAPDTRVIRNGIRLGTTAGFGIRRRWWLWADLQLPEVGARRVIVGHLPPMRVWKRSQKWDHMVRAYRQLSSTSPYPVVGFADWNRLDAAVRPATGQRALMDRIDGWALTPGQGSATSWSARVGSDHPARVLALGEGQQR